MSENTFVGLFSNFIIAYVLLISLGPIIDNAFSTWTGIFAPFGAIIRFLAPGPNEYILTFIESLIITAKV